ncbi:MAG: DUF1622 domain-containing protein [bacterium]|nr:DUF1622 domain-containing protein [bacterium]
MAGTPASGTPASRGVIVVIRTVISFSLSWELSQERKHGRERSRQERVDGG